MTKEAASFGEVDSFRIADDLVYFSSFFPYEISVFSLDGELRQRFAPTRPEFGQALKRDNVTKALKFVVGTLAILPYKGRIMNVLKGRNLETKSQYSIFDIFKEKGESITSFPATLLSEDFVVLADINHNGYLAVCATNPYPRIHVFQIGTLLQ